MTTKKKLQLTIENEQVIVPAQVCAMVFGVTTRTINEWAKRGCPKLGKDAYNLREVISWKYNLENKPESLEAKKAKADIRYREARADMEEMKRRAMVGEFVAVEDIRGELVEVFSQVKIGLLSIKQKVLQQLYSTYPECAFDVASLVEKEVERGLVTLANANKYNRSKRHTKKGD